MRKKPSVSLLYLQICPPLTRAFLCFAPVDVWRMSSFRTNVKSQRQNIGEDDGKKKKKSSDPPSSKTTDGDKPGPSPDVLLVPGGGGSPALVIEAAPGSYMYGPVLALTSTTADAQETLEYLDSIFHTGYACILHHKPSEVNIRTRKGNMRLTKRTGVHEVDKKTAPSGKSLATIFELEFNRAPKFNSPEGHESHGLGDKTVARAVVAYRGELFGFETRHLQPHGTSSFRSYDSPQQKGAVAAFRGFD